ncbi:DUF3078 domain-containing protein [Salinimicrobium tongyeongense]|uniref:DUF3078 domain-containing protein n=1 Tax=Salinimicrobium tongyeongense TaxID=2809707 RepID=A0ABY6NU80_9FLAO|nr:DUF3078 domain-containing protein [Salinimicrobium tongyeongense]UZH56462.1 DUF3078 domain-containing protein [Salinimicrobium tongyeongense]
MKKFLLFTFILFAFAANAQDENEDQNETPPDGWTSEGKFQLLFNQSAFNAEWTGGGTSSMAANLVLDYNLNYRKGNFTWDNKFLANYGLTKLKADEFTRKTSDRLEINSILGKQMEDSNWYYSFFTNFRTQFSKGYVYSEDPETGQPTRRETTHFISPAYLQFGPGMMWKKNEDFWVNLAPATARFIFVDPEFTSVPGYVDGSYYGVDTNKSTRFELGASLSSYFKYEVMTNVTMEHNLSLYSNYLDHPENIDIDYLLNLDMGINKYLSANFIFQAIYDDNIVGAFQVREVFGAGFTYTF